MAVTSVSFLCCATQLLNLAFSFSSPATNPVIDDGSSNVIDVNKYNRVRSDVAQWSVQDFADTYIPTPFQDTLAEGAKAASRYIFKETVNYFSRRPFNLPVVVQPARIESVRVAAGVSRGPFRRPL